MSSISHGANWDTPFSSEFDAAWADEQLAKGDPPFLVAEKHLADDGAFDSSLVVWLAEHGCDLYDIGRLARQVGVDAPTFMEARRRASAGVDLARGFMLGRAQRPMPEKSPDFDDRIRQTIFVDDPESRRLAKLAWNAIEKANDPPQVFKFGDSVTWVAARNDGTPKVQVITKEKFGFLHHRTIEWASPVKVGHIETEPPLRVVTDMLADPHPPVPNLAGVRVAPVFGPSGRLAVDPGYDANSQMFVWPRGLDIPFVPSKPSQADIANARNLIEFELMGDFPFDDEASRAHAIAALLHPFVRPMIAGATPLHLVDKPAAGTGAGLLVEAMTLPGLGQAPTITTVGKLEDERQFRLVALLRNGPISVLFDNINKKLDSETIAAMITAPNAYEGRIIRSSESVVIPIRCLWLATGNNVQVAHEMTRRCVLIRLDAGMEHPEEGRVFRHERLMDWAREHRGELVWAALVLVQAWVSAGMPRGSKSKGTFEAWAEIMGGILEACGIPGFLENTDKMKEFSDPEADGWIAFVEEWWERFGENIVGSGDLLHIAESHLPDLAQNRGDRPTTWGIMLRSKKDAVVAGKKIVSAKTKQRAAQWRLQPMNHREPPVNLAGKG